MPEASSVRAMFASVARRYDLLNRLLSCGIDRRWRRAAVRFAGVRPGELAADVCAGTGDLALLLARRGLRVVGVDFCCEMLERTRRKEPGVVPRPLFVAGDALALPLPDRAFDLVTVAFGVRNLADPERGLAELRRVLRPGGRAIVLEFCMPRGAVLGPLYRFYFQRVVPRVGRLVSDAKTAYDYLPRSVRAFPQAEGFLPLLTAAGFTACRMQLLSGGIAALYRGEAAG
jgi:demethylmenaquinone methyltransferase/2-methoxy-6-polyprenyl-1,4-benzoquinol methylase